MRLPVTRVLGALLAAAFFIGNALALMIAGFAAVVYPDENARPENTGQYDGVLTPAVITFALSLVVLMAVVSSRRRLALGAFSAHLAASGVLLVIALHLSAASDARLLVFAAVVELVGVAALLMPTPNQGQKAAPMPGS